MAAVPSTSNALPVAVERVKLLAGSFKAEAVSIRDTSAAGNITADDFFRFLDRFSELGKQLAAIQITPAMDTWAANNIEGYSGVLSVDVDTAISAAVGVVSWIRSNFPNDGTYVLSHQINVDGSLTARTFTPAQTAGFRTALASFILTIS